MTTEKKRLWRIVHGDPAVVESLLNELGTLYAVVSITVTASAAGARVTAVLLDAAVARRSPPPVVHACCVFTK